MAKRRKQPTKTRIVKAAWNLFYKQGYDATTVEEIIQVSNTSKGSFYHYFKGKDSLLSSLSYLFDEKYEELLLNIDPTMNSYDKLLYFNHELFYMIETTVDVDLLGYLYSSQLVTRDKRHLLDEDRVYYRVITQILEEGLERGELKKEYSAHHMMKLYALQERALLYDWSLCKADYSLTEYSDYVMDVTLRHFKAE